MNMKEIIFSKYILQAAYQNVLDAIKWDRLALWPWRQVP